MPPHSEICYPNVGNVFESWFENKSDILCSGPNMSLPGVEKIKTTAFAKFREPRNVSFFPEVEIFEIPNVRDLPRHQINSMYLSRDEMSSIHKEAWKIVDLMNLGIEYIEEEGFSKRGLVDLKNESVERRKWIREQAYKIVFGVQAFQAGKKTVDCMDANEVLADLYRKSSAQAQKEAQMTARIDAFAAGRR